MGGLQHRPRVTCRPVCRGWLGWGGGYNTDRVLRAVLSVCRGVTTGQHITWSICGGGVCNTDCVTCRPVCRGWLGWGGGYNTDRVLRAVLSVGVGYNTDRVLRAVLSVCRGVTTGQHITWSICGGGFATQTVLRAVLSVGVG